MEKREKTKHTSSQNDKILDFIRKNGSITQGQAIIEFNCYRLSARIFDLKEKGYDIRTIMCVKKNEDGNVVQYAKYVLKGEQYE